jgi:quercetin dioxygenase-like cupin family protein
MAQELVEDPVGRQRYAFRRASDEEGDEVLQVDLWIDPGGDVPPHRHPRLEERFEVVEGEMTFTLGRKRRRVAPGESAVVPAGARHAFRNSGGATAYMRVEVQPPMEQQELLEDFAAVARAGYLARLGPLRFPRSPRGLLQVALLTRYYRESETAVILTPPPALQRLIVDPLARLAERRGYTARGFARASTG